MKKRMDSPSLKAILNKLSVDIEIMAQYVRYSEKPSDLVLPTNQLIQMAHRLEQFRTQWLLKWLTAGAESLKNWPKLWERYL